MTRKRAPNRLREVQCVNCQTMFETRHSQGKYCSPDCSRDSERKSWREYGERNRETRRAYYRAHYERNREAIVERIKKYRKTAAGKRAAKVADLNQMKKHPEKYAARQAVLMAMRKGELVRQPCARCGEKRTQAHHADYSKPLEVIWLCVPCHWLERPVKDESGKVGVVIEDGRVAAVN